MGIVKPQYLTKEIHRITLNALRSELLKFNEIKKLPPELPRVRVRNWLFFIEEGVPTVDIILDKGYNPDDIKKNVVPRFANTSLSFDECAEIHQYLLSTHALDELSDEVTVRVGSPGAEPTLFDIEDFQASINQMVRIETWDLKEGRSKFTMILVDIFVKEGNSVAVVAEGAKRFEIPLDDIKSAFVLPFHPASKSVKSAKKASFKSKTK